MSKPRLYLVTWPLINHVYTGIVGPLLIHGDHIQGYAMCPFATTEGALVASATRGAALLTRAGGVTCKVLHKRIGRSLAIMCDSLHEANKLQQWVEVFQNNYNY